MVHSFLTASCALLLSALWTTVSAETPAAVGKRELLSSRQSECSNPSWIPACPGLFACIPPGGICCSDGISYAMPPETCPDGTEPIATAVTVGIPVAPSTTPAPTPTPSTVLEYTWYTYTITYYYYYYFYTYIALSASLTSSQKMFFTTVSLTATDDGEASSLYASLSATIAAEVTAQTGTPTQGAVPSATQTPVGTAATTLLYPTGNVTVPRVSAPVPPEFSGAAVSVFGGKASLIGSWFVWVVGAGALVPGALMVWL
ncbi:hypothetical protein BU23DRAFT_75509 [Bimuria novae-zelandiae CBS 107.79]|uniref:Uncharacterized protein n=1 Tax=Bimuria novae-zelandiae CBS 107.79 TaxID=1447943 RepID=A0A6A5VEI3_9PLEO|nr:hypothetical protein BU23DRAFT_75509 [Bimuria novae-zelandiae CBS 107.79]